MPVPEAAAAGMANLSVVPSISSFTTVPGDKAWIGREFSSVGSSAPSALGTLLDRSQWEELTVDPVAVMLLVVSRLTPANWNDNWRRSGSIMLLAYTLEGLCPMDI